MTTGELDGVVHWNGNRGGIWFGVGDTELGRGEMKEPMEHPHLPPQLAHPSCKWTRTVGTEWQTGDKVQLLGQLASQTLTSPEVSSELLPC